MNTTLWYTIQQLTLVQPVPVPGVPGSVDGIIFTIAARTGNDPNGVVLIDEANGATVTLTGTTSDGTTITPMQTTSNYYGTTPLPACPRAAIPCPPPPLRRT